jgi:hypothetical protein
MEQMLHRCHSRDLIKKVVQEYVCPFVPLDEGPCCIEESGYFLVSHLFVNLPAGLHLTLVMKFPYSPAT